MGDLNWKDILNGFGVNFETPDFSSVGQNRKPLSTIQKVIIGLIAVLVIGFARQGRGSL
jgi:hypothetical protein